MNNYTFKVTPDPKGSPNSKPLPAPPPKEEQEKLAEPCPPSIPGPCPPNMPGPCPPGMPEPVYPPVTPIIPSPPSFGLPPIYPQYPEYPGQPGYPVVPGYPIYSIRVAHSYTPWQYYNVVYGPREALDKGTMFPELFQPQGVYGPCEGPQPCKAIFPWGGAPYGC